MQASSVPPELHDQLLAGRGVHQAGGGAQTMWGSTLGSGRWMKEEHDDFLAGLQVCGKDWAAISARFVPSRSVTQVRTHAQKYFIKMERGQAFPEEPYESSLHGHQTSRRRRSSSSSSSSTTTSTTSTNTNTSTSTSSSSSTRRRFVPFAPRDAIRSSRTRSGARSQAALAQQKQQAQAQGQEQATEQAQEQEQRQSAHPGLVCVGDVAQLLLSSCGDKDVVTEAMSMPALPQLPSFSGIGIPSQQWEPVGAVGGAEGYHQLRQVGMDCGGGGGGGGGGIYHPFPFNARDLAQSGLAFAATPIPGPREETEARSTSAGAAVHDALHQQHPRAGSDGGGGGGMDSDISTSLALGAGRTDMEMDLVMDMDIDMDMGIGMDVGMDAQPGVLEGCGDGPWAWHDRYPGLVPGAWDYC